MEVSAAFAVDDRDGPIVGQRIEQYPEGQAAAALERSRSAHTLPCEFTEQSTRWRTEEVPLPAMGDDSWAFVTESLDGPKGYTYNTAVEQGDHLNKLAVSLRQRDDQYVADLTGRAAAKAQALPG